MISLISMLPNLRLLNENGSYKYKYDYKTGHRSGVGKNTKGRGKGCFGGGKEEKP